MTRSLSGVEVLFFSGYASFKNIFFLTVALKLVQMSVSYLFPAMH
jgi:hypothetical protein